MPSGAGVHCALVTTAYLLQYQLNLRHFLISLALYVMHEDEFSNMCYVKTHVKYDEIIFIFLTE